MAHAHSMDRRLSATFAGGILVICSVVLIKTPILNFGIVTRKVSLLGDAFEAASIDPRHVFLYYTRTEKTSSTVAASLIMEAYKRAGIAISNFARGSDAQLAGSYASIGHDPFNMERVKAIEKRTNKPVILVVSTRDGEDWLESYIARAESETKKVSDGGYVNDKNICDKIKSERAKWRFGRALSQYKSYLPIYTEPNANSDKNSSPIEKYTVSYTPWAVIRHEHVVDDTCDILKRLGMTCNRKAAFGQASRHDVGLGDCDFKSDPVTVKNINTINRLLWRSRAESDKISRG